VTITLKIAKNPIWKHKNGDKRVMKRLRKLEGVNVNCVAEIRSFTNVWNKYNISVCLNHLQINHFKIDHMWVKSNDLYRNFLLYDQIRFQAKVYCYRKKNGKLGFTLCNLKEIKLIEV